MGSVSILGGCKGRISAWLSTFAIDLLYKGKERRGPVWRKWKEKEAQVQRGKGGSRQQLPLIINFKTFTRPLFDCQICVFAFVCPVKDVSVHHMSHSYARKREVMRRSKYKWQVVRCKLVSPSNCTGERKGVWRKNPKSFGPPFNLDTRRRTKSHTQKEKEKECSSYVTRLGCN